MSATKTAWQVMEEAIYESLFGDGKPTSDGTLSPSKSTSAAGRKAYTAAAQAVIEWYEAQRQKSVESSTYGDLVKACPLVAENIVNHEWDNLPIWQQRDWLMKQLAQRPAWPPMRPLSDPDLPNRFLVALKTHKLGEATAGEPRIEFASRHWSRTAISVDFGGGEYSLDSHILLGWWPMPEVPR